MVISGSIFILTGELHHLWPESLRWRKDVEKTGKGAFDTKSAGISGTF
jgi:hypothetical protein